MFESLTQQEIFSQPESLKKTLEYLLANRNTVADFFHRYEGRKMIFMGCGSSAMLAKSARAIFGKGSSPSYALTGGEYLIAPERYAYLFEPFICIMASYVILHLLKQKRNAMNVAMSLIAIIFVFVKMWAFCSPMDYTELMHYVWDDQIAPSYLIQFYR